MFPSVASRPLSSWSFSSQFLVPANCSESFALFLITTLRSGDERIFISLNQGTPDLLKLLGFWNFENVEWVPPLHWQPATKQLPCSMTVTSGALPDPPPPPIAHQSEAGQQVRALGNPNYGALAYHKLLGSFQAMCYPEVETAASKWVLF